MTLQNAPEPRESYSYSLATDDLKHIRKHFRRPLTYLQAISPALLILIFIFSPSFVQYRGWIIALAINIAAYIVYKIRWNELYNSLTGTVYSLEIYNNWFTVTVDRLLTEKQTCKVNLASITKIADAGTCLIITANGGKYYVKKDILAGNSSIYAAAATLGRKYSGKPIPRKIKTASLVFALLSVTAFFGAVFISVYIFAVDNKIYIDLILMLLVFPALSAVYLLILSFKGYCVTKYFVISFISAALISCVVVFTGLTYIDSYIDTTEPISCAEEYFDIDIPEYESMRTYPRNIFDRRHYLSVVNFDGDVFRETVYGNSSWLQNPPEALEDIAVYVEYNRYYYADADFVMLYNIDTGELNTLPSESGRYHFIAVYFESHARNDTLYIVEYDVTYSK